MAELKELGTLVVVVGKAVGLLDSSSGGLSMVLLLTLS